MVDQSESCSQVLDLLFVEDDIMDIHEEKRKNVDELFSVTESGKSMDSIGKSRLIKKRSISEVNNSKNDDDEQCIIIEDSGHSSIKRINNNSYSLDFQPASTLKKLNDNRTIVTTAQHLLPQRLHPANILMEEQRIKDLRSVHIVNKDYSMVDKGSSESPITSRGNIYGNSSNNLVLFYPSKSNKSNTGNINKNELNILKKRKSNSMNNVRVSGEISKISKISMKPSNPTFNNIHIAESFFLASSIVFNNDTSILSILSKDTMISKFKIYNEARIFLANLFYNRYLESNGILFSGFQTVLNQSIKSGRKIKDELTKNYNKPKKRRDGTYRWKDASLNLSIESATFSEIARIYKENLRSIFSYENIEKINFSNFKNGVKVSKFGYILERLQSFNEYKDEKIIKSFETRLRDTDKDADSNNEVEDIILSLSDLKQDRKISSETIVYGFGMSYLKSFINEKPKEDIYEKNSETINTQNSGIKSTCLFKYPKVPIFNSRINKIIQSEYTYDFVNIESNNVKDINYKNTVNINVNANSNPSSTPLVYI